MELKQKSAFIFMLTLLFTGVLAFATGCTESVFNRDVSGSTQRSSIQNQYFTDGLSPPAEWNKTYGGSGWDVANSFIQTSDGGYLLVGYTESYGAGNGDFWLVKTNSAGRILWNQTYGGAEYDEAEAVMLADDGGYVLAGVTRSYGAGVTDFWLVKTDSNGNCEWNQTYGGTGLEYLFSAIKTSDNGFALAGYTESYGVGGDFWLVKTDSGGTLEWSEVYGGEGWDEAHAIVQNGDGGYAIVGETDSIGAGLTDVWWVEVSSDGKKQRDQAYGGVNNDGGYALVQTADGGYVIAGYTESFGLGIPYYPDFWLLKIDSRDRTLWDRTYGGLDADSAESLVNTSSGGLAVAGATKSYGAGDQDFWLVTTDSAGNLNYNQTYGGVGYDYAYSVIEASDSGLALTGDTFSYGAGSADMWLIKTEGSIPRHDIAVIDVAPSKSVVGQGYSTFISVTFENQGNRLETFNATVRANATIVDTLSSMRTITPGSIKIVSFIWNTSKGDFERGNYYLGAEAEIEPPIVDVDPSDNSYTDDTVTVSFPGDVNADSKVDLYDVYDLGTAYSSSSVSLNWNANCDVDNNGIVNALDLSVINENYGRVSN